MELSRTILLVDDEHVIHELFDAFIENEPYRLLHDYEGKQAHQFARRDRPDVIVLDVTMPETDGRDICRKLKTDPETCSIPVILFSGRSEYFERLSGLEAGADEYVTKPCGKHYLFRTIEKVLRKQMEYAVCRQEERVLKINENQAFCQNSGDVHELA